ncbi:Ger(x)C family spore germination protein [Anaerobacillus sp. MEB173]|uniref:Ger(x)C family spore germination protein n=1 Tax=Anaerobacillus sp. MEB173 TaxID=3383345 RepID=UPI003F926805
MTKKLIFLFLCVSSLLMSGCWDRTEIEEIGFLTAVAIDPLTEEEEKIENEKFEKETGIKLNRKSVKRFKSTFQVAVPGALASSDGGGASGKPFFNITSTDMTNFKMGRNVGMRRSRMLNFEHLKVIIINYKMLEQPEFMEKLLDFYIRDHEMRRQTYVLVSEMPASATLEHKLPLETMPAISIRDIRENFHRELPMPTTVTIGKIAENIVAENSFIVPRIVHNQTTHGIKIAGAAVFQGKENRMLGWLGEEDVMGYHWIMGEGLNGILQVPFEEEDDAFFVYENLMDASKVTYKRENDQLKFQVEIRAEGIFGESWFRGVEISDPKIQDQLSDAVAKRIEQQATMIIDKMQNEFHVDPFEFWREVRKKDYKYWKKIEDKWDGADGEFAKADITVNANVKIRHYMLNERLD